MKLLHFSITSLLFFALIGTQLLASSNENNVALIIKIEGKAKVLPNDSIKKHTVQKGEKIFQGDKLITYKNAKVVLKLMDKSDVIVNESSELTLISLLELDQTKGEVYYKIKKRSKSRGLKVKTPFSIIGIKGTEFIVNSDKNANIALNEGSIAIESLRAKFELHKKKLMNEFEAYKRKQDKAFDAYKHPDAQEEVSYVKSFELEANHIINFSDAKDCDVECESYVKEDTFNEQTNNLFSQYQQFLEE